MVYSPTPISDSLGWGWGGSPPKRSRTLEKSRVPWCGKQDLKRLGTINLKQYKYQKALFFNDFFQFEKIWKNREKRQLHSQLHSNCIQKMAVSPLPRTTTCSSSMAGLFFFAHDGSFIALSNKTIKESKNSE